MVASIRSEIRKLGGEVRFSNKLVNVKTDNGEICGAVVESDSGEYVIETNNIVLAIGHSARDTFLMLQNRNIAMEQKSFSVGARIEPVSYTHLDVYKRQVIDVQKSLEIDKVVLAVK